MAKAKAGTTKSASAKHNAGAKKNTGVGSKAAATPGAAGSEEAYERFVTKARALDASAVIPMRADPTTAHHNVNLAVPEVLAQEAAYKGELPKANWKQFKELPAIALAVVFAANRVDRNTGSTGEIAAMLSKARELREVLLTSAVALAAAGIIPARDVERIQEGKGFFDIAGDCSDLSALFRKHNAALKGKTHVTAAQIKEAGEVGAALLKVLRPASAKRSRKAPVEVANAADIRDRLWTLLVLGYRELRRVGMWIWMDEVDAHVPPLGSRASSGSRKAGGDAPKAKSGKASKEPAAAPAGAAP